MTEPAYRGISRSRITSFVRPGDDVPHVALIHRFGLIGVAVGKKFYGYNSDRKHFCTGTGYFYFQRKPTFPFVRVRTLGQMIRSWRGE